MAKNRSRRLRKKLHIEEFQELGLLKGQSVESVAFLLWSIVHGIASLIIRRGSAMKNLNISDNQKVVESALEVLNTILK